MLFILVHVVLTLTIARSALRFRLEVQWTEHVSLILLYALRKLGTEPSICASHQVLVHLSQLFLKRFQCIWPSGFRGEVFRNRPTRKNNLLWQPCFKTDRDEMRYLDRRPSKDAFYQISVHL
jgi:hypothetical protein